MLNLPNVTLCCVDTAHHVLSTVALRHCRNEVNFGKVIHITDRPEFVDPDVELHKITAFTDWVEYNRFILKGLYHHIETDFVLIVQFDGFVLNTNQWTDDYLKYDYIGAPWPCTRKEYAVGTGGFSLRSRKLLKALQDDHIIMPKESAAEDLAICRTYKSMLEVHHGIEYAPWELAQRFAYESADAAGETFGFHGLMLLADVYPADMAPFVIENLQPYLMKNPQATSLALRYALYGHHDMAEKLMRRIAEAQSCEEARNKLLDRVPGRDDIMELFDQAWQRYITDKAA